MITRYKSKPPRAKIIKKGSEDDVQSQVIAYLKYKYPSTLYCATVGGIRTTFKQAVKMKRTGYVKGIPDLLIFEPRGTFHGLMIEMKKDKNSYATKEQKEWQEKLNARGYRSEICKSFEDAKRVIDEYLS